MRMYPDISIVKRNCKIKFRIFLSERRSSAAKEIARETDCNFILTFNQMFL